MKTASVYFSSANNSTHFTTCCAVAITADQANCPMCGKEILERSQRSRNAVAMIRFLSGKRRAL